MAEVRYTVVEMPGPAMPGHEFAPVMFKVDDSSPSGRDWRADWRARRSELEDLRREC